MSDERRSGVAPAGDPRAGDVIFLRAPGAEALVSGLLQRMVINRSSGPLFSHVAVTLSDRVAIEASTAAEKKERTWSGSPLGEGVRLQLVPDLVIGAATVSVLRHPSSPDLSRVLDVYAPSVSQLLGSGYSTRTLVANVRKAHALLARLLPADWFEWTAKPDRIATVLRTDSALRAGLERHLRTGQALDSLKDYFCSQLVAVLLHRAELMPHVPGLVTPCALHDQLLAGGWRDVTATAYGVATIEGWKRVSHDDWRALFGEDVALAAWFRESAVTGPTLDLADELVASFSASLDAIARTLASN